MNDLAQLIVDIANWVYAIVGSLVLLFFIYGGFVFLTSAGSSDRVTKGKRIIIGSIIGLFIVFFSYTIIGFIFAQLDIPEATNFASTGWFK